MERRIRVAVLAILRRTVGNEQLVTRKADVDRDVVAIPVAMAVTRQFDDDVARHDSVEKALDRFRMAFYMVG